MSTRFGKTSWKEFTAEDLAIIEQERDAVKANPLVMLPTKEYGMVCRACTKPNAVKQTFCTGCSFPCTPEDIQQLPDNIFLDIIKGKNTGTNVVYRDDKYLVFDDKFGVSDNHVDVIPVEVILDISVLTKEHIPMLQDLYQQGLNEFKKRNLKAEVFDNLDELVTAGYNFPVSVKHLHLHMVLPPFKHKKVFQYPRWHSHKKVIADLQEHGRVITFNEQPNDQAGAEEYERAMKNNDLVSSKL